MDVKIEESWKRVLDREFQHPYFQELVQFVKSAYASGTCYPPSELIFNAFDQTPYDQVKVVILGQDPYHEPGQAQGLAFYVPSGIRTPPSLLNIAKELASDGGCASADGSIRIPNLMSWARQGVLLLNATLTVKAQCAASHQGHGWERFTDAVVNILATQREGLVFILWGASAQKKGKLIDRSRHLVIESAHPSPLSAHRGFFGSKPFSKCNEYLKSKGKLGIDW